MSNKVPVKKNEEERLEALKSYSIMDSLPEEVYDNITELASIICGTPIALVSLLDGKRQWFKSKVGLGARETDKKISFCQYAILENKIFEVTNVMDNPLFADNPLVKGDPNIRFYAGAPLTDEDGYNLGTLCVIDSKPNKLSDKQARSLTLLAKEVISQLSARRKSIEFKSTEEYFNRSMDMICIVNSDGYFKKVNPRFLKVLGYSKKELLSKPLVEFIHKKDREATSQKIEELVNGTPIIEFQNRFKCKNGKFKIFSWNAGVEVKTGDMFAMARDVTEREKAKKKLKLEKETAEKATQSKDEFLANMSHEIRTPMNAVLGFTELLNSTKVTGEQEEYIQSIQLASRNLLSIINDILDYSKIESGVLDFNIDTFLINEMLDHVKKTMNSLSLKKGLKLQFFGDSDIRLPVFGDESRLNQVFTNLIANSIKFTETGKVEIFTSLQEETQDSYEVCFLIKDSGIGIAKEKLPEIFSRFRQAEKYTTKKYGGTGLGLSISKRIIEAMNGKLLVKSELGKGSEFSFNLKFQKNNVIKRNPILFEKEKIVDISKAHILLIEDNDLNQVLVSKFLSLENVKLTIVDNGKSGIDKLKDKANDFDIILMDLQMPEMNGYEATKIIRSKLKSNIPIIAMTAHSLVGERKRCIELGMNEYISKPYTKKELLAKIGGFFQLESRYSKENEIKTVNNPLYEEIDKLGRGNPVFVKKMIGIFLKSTPRDMKKLIESSKKKDKKEMRIIAHRLKSSFSMFGLTEALDLATRLERKEEAYSEGLMWQDIEKLKIILDDVFKQFKSYN